MNRTEIIAKLRDLCGKVSCLKKEIMSAEVPGLLLTREDLGIRLANSKKQKAHGQVHKQPTNTNSITAPSGMGTGVPKVNIGPIEQL